VYDSRLLVDNVISVLVLLICLKVLNKYCSLIETVERRLEIGAKCGCHDCVIEVSVHVVQWLTWWS